jgi:hypothetical protein
LFCEHSQLPVHILGDNPTAGVYELEMPRAWVVKAAPALKVAAGVLSVALPGAKLVAQIDLGEEAWEKLRDRVDAAKESLANLVDHLADKAGEVAREGDQQSHVTASSTLSGADLRQLHAVLNRLDPSFGGLEKVRTNLREPLWVHPRFVEAYNPKPPVVLAHPSSAG